MVNPNWTRWIFASLSKYFDDSRGDYPLLIEGEERDPNLSPRAELRMNGPYYDEITKGNWRIDINLSVLISVAISNNIYDLAKILGHFQAAFIDSILIFKLGDGPDDDGSELGCMVIVNYGDDTVTTNNFGQIGADIRLLQSEVTGTYRMRLEVK